MNGKRWRVELEPDVQREFDRITAEEERGAEAIDGFLRFVHRSPEEGYAFFRDDPDTRSRPFHTATNAYVVLYAFDAERVTCLGIKPIPYTAPG